MLRLVCGMRGRVSVQLELALRFEYGSVVPTISRDSGGRWKALATNGQALLATPVTADLKDGKVFAQFTVAEGEEVPFSLTWAESTVDPPDSPTSEPASSAPRIPGRNGPAASNRKRLGRRLSSGR